MNSKVTGKGDADEVKGVQADSLMGKNANAKN